MFQNVHNPHVFLYGLEISSSINSVLATIELAAPGTAFRVQSIQHRASK